MKTDLDLSNFLPYQLTQLQSCVADIIADVYANEFDLSRQQWRVLAALGQGEALTAKQISLQTALDKMSASRAIAQMSEKKLLKKTVNVGDKRSSLLILTKKGFALYQKLAPKVLAREKELLSVLTSQEFDDFKSTMEKLSSQSKLILSNNEIS